MIFKPTTNQGRLAQGSTPYGDYRVEWDAQGRLVSHSITIRTPTDAIPAPACVPCAQGKSIPAAPDLAAWQRGYAEGTI